jgi:hypothetical protein
VVDPVVEFLLVYNLVEVWPLLDMAVAVSVY